MFHLPILLIKNKRISNINCPLSYSSGYHRSTDRFGESKKRILPRSTLNPAVITAFPKLYSL